ncbi:MAG: hypothetical protein ACI4SH_07955 [Candidatus Scatosoma sp.]
MNTTDTKRRIFAGYYKRLTDGLRFYVVDVVKDLETEQEVVICKKVSRKEYGTYFTLTREAFCAKILYEGVKRNKYYREAQRSGMSELERSDLECDGYRKPIVKQSKFEKIRECRQKDNYFAYAKDICEWYTIDIKNYQLSIGQKKIMGFGRKKDFLAAKEDLRFLSDCLKTTLSEYASFFEEHFANKISLRKYAERHQLNRGSVDYIKKKFLIAFSSELEKRDLSDGIKRIKTI